MSAAYPRKSSKHSSVGNDTQDLPLCRKIDRQSHSLQGGARFVKGSVNNVWSCLLDPMFRFKKFRCFSIFIYQLTDKHSTGTQARDVSVVVNFVRA